MIASDPCEAILEDLDEDQRLAVTTDAVYLAIIAPAGSGKTRVLTTRIAWRAHTGRADPRRVLALTFTRRAAGELRQRLKSLHLRDHVPAGTFHSVAYSLLTSIWRDRRQTPPRLLTDRSRVIRTCLDDTDIEPSVVDQEIGWAKSRCLSAAEYSERARAERRPKRIDPDVVTRVFERYEEERRRRHLLDFDDLLRILADELMADRRIGEAVRWRFRHLFVDEFQDVNPLQFRLLQALLGPDSELTVVGDPRQAIYSWNGADACYLEQFEDYFPGGEVVELRTSFRCPGPNLRAAVALLPERWRHVSALKDDGVEPTISQFPDDRSEADGIAERIIEALARGMGPASHAVLVRTNTQVRHLSSRLRRRGLPVTETPSPVLDGDATRRILEFLAPRPDTPAETLAADLRAAQRELPEELSSTARALAELVSELVADDPGADFASLRSWLAEIASGPRDAVQVLTFHASKGLEWPVVHLAGLEEGLVPIWWARTESALAEEMRLLHVAITRATREVHLSWCARRRTDDGEEAREPSRFLATMAARPLNPERHSPAELLELARICLDNYADGRAPDATDPEVADRITRLRAWRTRMARAAAVADKAILSDTAIAEIAENDPGTVDELAELQSVGPLRARRWGETIITLLHQRGRLEDSRPQSLR
ncbi:MAG: DNA helicase [Acidimicrobiales bacterium]|nr:MAG: DNA helicase [Acidimicrobiales bacterium]